MITQLYRGQPINLRRPGNNSPAARLNNFCVGVKWGVVEEKKKRFFGPAKILRKPIDLDLSCLIFFEDAEEQFDYLYSPEYKPESLAKIGLPPGKLLTKDGSLSHSGDDQTGDIDGNDPLDNEIISVDLRRLDPGARAIYFFLNNLGPEDFARIPYARLRIYEGSPTHVKDEFATFKLEANPAHQGRRAVIMGKLEKQENGEWQFTAIGETTDDANFAETIARLRRAVVPPAV